jgi:hypothetical protein
MLALAQEQYVVVRRSVPMHFMVALVVGYLKLTAHSVQYQAAAKKHVARSSHAATIIIRDAKLAKNLAIKILYVPLVHAWQRIVVCRGSVQNTMVVSAAGFQSLANTSANQEDAARAHAVIELSVVMTLIVAHGRIIKTTAQSV